MNIDNVNSPENVKKRIDENLLLKVLNEISSLKGQPRMQIFITHGFLELLMNVLIKNKAKNGKKITSDNRTYSYSVQILILYEIGILTKADYDVYDWFRKMRNRAAHEPLFSVRDEDLKRLSKHNTIDEFDHLCFDLMTRLWNANIDILVPAFTPTLVNQ